MDFEILFEHLTRAIEVGIKQAAACTMLNINELRCTHRMAARKVLEAGADQNPGCPIVAGSAAIIADAHSKLR